MAKVVAVVATTRSTNVRGRREQFDVFFAVDVGAVGLGLGERCSASGRAMASAAKDPAKAVPASLSANVVVRSVQHGSASAFSHQATVSRTVDEQSTSPSIASTESSPSVAVVAKARSTTGVRLVAVRVDERARRRPQPRLTAVGERRDDARRVGPHAAHRVRGDQVVALGRGADVHAGVIVDVGRQEDLSTVHEHRDDGEREERNARGSQPVRGRVDVHRSRRPSRRRRRPRGRRRDRCDTRRKP